jgi:hypothetical protein
VVVLVGIDPDQEVFTACVGAALMAVLMLVIRIGVRGKR